MTKARLFVVCLLAVGITPVVTAIAMQRGTGTFMDVGLLAGVIQLVEHEYVRPVSSDELTEDALKGMLNRLDPHSDYMDEQEFKLSEADIAGKFGGLGMQISEQDGLARVVSPIDGTPAARAGLEPGDEIVGINHASTQGMPLSNVVALLRGDPGSEVTLTISRGTQAPFDVKLTRQIIRVDSVQSKLEPDNIGYIRITQFSDDTADGFKRAIGNLKREANGHLTGLVLDLRNDPGGLVSAAVDVSGDLLNGGTVVSMHGRRASEDETLSAPAKGDLLPGIPAVVLINGGSASASEIVAGALQDHHRAITMGTQSFGKGSVQTIVPLKRYGAIRLTTALYYTPSGRSIQDKGITPDIVVDAPKDQQVAEASAIGESTLHGAFENPGPLETSSGAATRKVQAIADRPVYSPPIKTEFIGKPDDAQLRAALSYLAEKTPTAARAH